MYDRVLVPTDGSPGTERAVDRGIDLARTFEADVHVFYAVDPRPYEGIDLAEEEELEQAAMESGRRAIARVRERAADAGLDVSQAIRTGIPHVEIRAYAESNDVDCVVMGTHGRTGAEGAALGSTTERVLRDADVPVLTVDIGDGSTGERDAASPTYEDVVVPTDGSDAAVRAAEHAVEFADRYGGTVHALYVVDSSVFEFEEAPRSLLGPLREGGQQGLAEIESLAADAGVAATTALEQGKPHRVILDHADGVGADLIALGRRGRTGLPEVLLGSTTARIVRTADVPVLSVT